jgi:hypothetical protein
MSFVPADPDTVMVALSREDAEIVYGSEPVEVSDFCAANDRIEAAVRAALEEEA